MYVFFNICEKLSYIAPAIWFFLFDGILYNKFFRNSRHKYTFKEIISGLYYELKDFVIAKEPGADLIVITLMIVFGISTIWSFVLLPYFKVMLDINLSTKKVVWFLISGILSALLGVWAIIIKIKARKEEPDNEDEE